MAAHSITLEPGTGAGLMSLPGVSASSAKTASRLLTENHKTHDIFFNAEGFHNHVSHYMLALYNLGAPSPVMERHYARETDYQRPLVGMPPDDDVPDLSKDEMWAQHLGKLTSYSTLLAYYQREIERRGVEEVVHEAFFAETERAEDMLVRLFGAFIHPFIHLGYGLEFKLPAIVAEALAMAATHPNWMRELFFPAEKAAEMVEDTSTTLISLLHAIQANEKLRMAPQWSDSNKVQGVLERAPQEMIAVAKQYKVPVDKLHQKMAESINFSALFTAAPQRADKEIRIDFYYMHAHNSGIFLPTYLAQPWISDAAKARLLEWKGRHDLALYASRRAPELRIDDVRNYVPKVRDITNPWLSVIDRAMRSKNDDGHIVKLVRACAHGERICAPYEDREDLGFVMKGDMWIHMAEMCIDSMEAPGVMWARSVGFEEAWKDYGPRIKY